MGIELSNNQKELIEKFGVIQEGMGLPPAVSRVNALLMISEKLELTFDEIRETLKLSKSATSNAINFLLQQENIGYKTHLGDRKRYFYSKLERWKDKFRKDISGLSAYTEVLKEIQINRSGESKEFDKKLEELSEFMDYFTSETISLIDKWGK
jgi:DNA-binding transcriptional regulator GbsR (MarR family)